MARKPRTSKPERVTLDVPAAQGRLLAQAKQAFETARKQFELVFATIMAGHKVETASLVDLVEKHGRWVVTILKGG